MTQPNSSPVAAKPVKLTDEELRLECAKLAVQSGAPNPLIVETAARIYGFVKSEAS